MRKLWMLCAVLAVTPALAQEEPARTGGSGEGSEASARTPPKTTSIDFEEDTIEGDLTRPDGEYIEARKKVKHSNLIRVREDFEEKVMQSVGEL